MTRVEALIADFRLGNRFDVDFLTSSLVPFEDGHCGSLVSMRALIQIQGKLHVFQNEAILPLTYSCQLQRAIAEEYQAFYDVYFD